MLAAWILKTLHPKLETLWIAVRRFSDFEFTPADPNTVKVFILNSALDQIFKKNVNSP